MPITAEQARNMLKTIEDKPDRWAASVNTVIADLVDRLDKTQAVIKVLYNQSKKNTADVGQIGRMLSAFAQDAGAGQSDADAEVASVQGDVPGVAGTSGVRTTDAGPITNPDQLAAEALMDAAIGDSSPPPVAQTPRVRRAGANGGRRPAASPVPSRNGADGKPLDAEQASIEAAMDAAIDG